MHKNVESYLSAKILPGSTLGIKTKHQFTPVLKMQSKQSY